MDTDDFPFMARDIIRAAAKVSDTLKTELGALARRCANEDEWLLRARVVLWEIIADPGGYVEYWDLESAEDVTPALIQKCAADLAGRAEEVLAVPLSRRWSLSTTTTWGRLPSC